MIFRPYYYFETGCAAYLFGCGGLGKCAVVDAHEEDVDAHIAFAASKGMRITHVIDTRVHADHRSASRDEFVAALSDVPPKPAEMEKILRINQKHTEEAS